MGFGGRPLVAIGLLLVFAGLIFVVGGFLGIGRLPGDFVFKKGGTTFYFPLVSSIIVSIVLTFLLNLLSGRH